MPFKSMVPVPANDVTVSFSADGITFSEIEGQTTFQVAGGEAPTSDVSSFQGAIGVAGHPVTPTATMEMVYSPSSPAIAALQAYAAAGTNLSWRVNSKEETLFGPTGAGVTAAIATTGIVTLSGTGGADFTDEEFQLGHSIVVGTSKVAHTISAISTSGVVTVSPPPAAQVTAATYKVIRPIIRWPDFKAGFVTIGQPTATADGLMQHTISLKLRRALTPPKYDLAN